MRLPRHPCARAGAFLLAGVVFALAPAVVHARSSFNNGLTKTIDEIVNLIADGSASNQPRREIRELRQALNELLDVLEGQGGGQHGMGKGMKHHRHHHHHHNIGAAAGNKDNGCNCTAAVKGQGNGKKGVGNAPGKSANSNRQPGNQTPATANARNGGSNNGVGGRLGNNKNLQNACKNTTFGNAKGGNSSGKAGAVFAGNTPANLARGAGKTATATPITTAAKGGAAINQKNVKPVAVKKTNGASNPIGLAALQQNRSPLAAGRQHAGASVGLRAASHGNSIRKR